MGYIDPKIQVVEAWKEIARLGEENARLRAAFRVNAIRDRPELSHAEIDAEIERIVRGDEQSTPTTVNDTDRLAWLQEQIVDTIYLDDGRIIDVRGNCVRAALDKAAADKQRGATHGN